MIYRWRKDWVGILKERWIDGQKPRRERSLEPDSWANEGVKGRRSVWRCDTLFTLRRSSSLRLFFAMTRTWLMEIWVGGMFWVQYWWHIGWECLPRRRVSSSSPHQSVFSPMLKEFWVMRDPPHQLRLQTDYLVFECLNICQSECTLVEWRKQ